MVSPSSCKTVRHPVKTANSPGVTDQIDGGTLRSGNGNETGLNLGRNNWSRLKVSLGKKTDGQSPDLKPSQGTGGDNLKLLGLLMGGTVDGRS